MAVDIPPRGTHGQPFPKLPPMLMRTMNALMYRVFRNNFQGSPLLRLTTVGAKSGLPRTTTVSYLADGDSWVIVASAGGSPTHPAWYFNLARNPDKVSIEVGDRHVHVRPEALKGAERDAVWQRIVAQSKSFASYPQKTDREIPVVRLHP